MKEVPFSLLHVRIPRLTVSCSSVASLLGSPPVFLCSTPAPSPSLASSVLNVLSQPISSLHCSYCFFRSSPLTCVSLNHSSCTSSPRQFTLQFGPVLLFSLCRVVCSVSVILLLGFPVLLFLSVSLPHRDTSFRLSWSKFSFNADFTENEHLTQLFFSETMSLLGNRSKSRSIKLVTGLYLLIYVNFMQNKSQKQTFRWKNS